jgi:hypothetical protein
MTFPDFLSVRTNRIVIPLAVAFFINAFLYLVLRPESISVLAPLLGSLWFIVEFVLIALFASSPLFYGWFTKKPWESALFGVLLTAFLYIPGFLQGYRLLGAQDILQSIAYGGALVLYGGGAGYLAARGGLRYHIVAVLFVLLWLITFLSGLN